jgi:para-nitrobenzyl esterase
VIARSFFGLTLASLLLASPARAEMTQIEGGTIEGVTLPSGVEAWLGVPFAAPPVRDLRWRPPQPVVPWQGIYHADRPAPECLQPLRSNRQNHYFGEEATSEDCLYLNIWAPAGQRDKLPVVVWVYGGGFNIGSASMANYSGQGLAADGVIRVNLAYRVGPLGFLAHPELSQEAAYGGSGNYGLMDLVAGLQWVRRNIAAFGGDPDNVTLAGQSAGSMAISVLQQSPLTQGLFHRIVAMSGSNFVGNVDPVPLATAEAQGLAMQQELHAASLADLRALPGDKVIASQTRRDPIVIDGHVVAGNAAQVFASGRQQDVPVMLGYTSDESFRPLGPVTNEADLAREVEARFPADAAAILAAYAGTDPARAAIDISRDSSVGVQMARWAAMQADHGQAPVFGYLFTRRQPYTEGVTFSDHDPATAGAYHSGDIPYWLRTRPSLNLFRQTRTWEPGDAMLEDEMAGALLAFARGGDPVSARVGTWPLFDPQAPRLVRLSLDPQAIDWPHWHDMGLFAQAVVPPPPAGRQPRD